MMVRRLISGIFHLCAALSSLAGAPPIAAAQPTPVESGSAEPSPAFEELYKNGRFSEAKALAQEALEAAERSGGPRDASLIVPLNNLARAQRALGKLREAEAFFKRAITLSESTSGPNNPFLPPLLNNLANLYRESGRLDEAASLFERDLGISVRLFGARDASVATTLNNLANLRRDQGRFAQAETLYKKAMAIHGKKGAESLFIATTLNNLAGLYHEQGSFAQAEALYRRALSAAEKAHGRSHPSIVIPLNNLANSCKRQGRYSEAEALYERALKIGGRGAGTKPADLAVVLNNLANLHRLQGRFEEAEALLLRDIRITQEQLGPKHRAVAVSLNNIGGLYRDRGLYPKAEEMFRKALSVLEESSAQDQLSAAVALANLAETFHLEGKNEEAKPLYSRALAVSDKAHGRSHPFAARVLTGQAASELAQGHAQEAAALSEQALLRLAGRPDAEGPEFKAGELPIAHETAAALTVLAQARLSGEGGRQGWLDAEGAASMAMDVIEDLRSGIVSHAEGADALALQQDRMSVVARFSEAYSIAVQAGFRLADLAAGDARERKRAAFEAWERGLARSLLELTALSRERDLPKELQAIKQRESAMDSALSSLQDRFFEARARDNGALAQTLERELEKKRDEKRRYLQGVRADRPALYELLHPKPVSIRAIQASLRPEEMLIEYAALSTGTAVFVLGRDFFEAAELPVAEAAVAKLVEDAAGAIRAVGETGGFEPLAGQGPEAFHALYQAVFAPVEGMIARGSQGRKPALIHLVPSGPLRLLPFESMVVEMRAEGWEEAGFLAERYAFSYWPSASLFQLASSSVPAPSSVKKALLAFADPVFNPEENAGEESGAFPLRRLEESAAEAALSGNAFGLRPREDWLYLRKRADEGELVELSESGALRDFRRILFATHGLQPMEASSLALRAREKAALLPEGSAGRSFALGLARRLEGAREPMIFLTLRPDRPAARDGLLAMSEVYGLRLDAELAALSGCVTGRGESVPGEGIMGLTRALFFAGARSALVSLWPVESQAAGEFMAGVFEKLRNRKETESVSMSVNAARLQASRGRQFPFKAMRAGRMIRGRVSGAHPFFWAPFVLYGDSR